MSVRTLIYDTEGDGLLKTTTRLHCAVTKEMESGRKWRFRPHEIGDFVDQLNEAETIVCHNQIHHDLPVLYKLHKWKPRRQQVVRDTLVMARLAFPYQKDLDFRLWRDGVLPGKLIGLHSLKAWGHRLGLHKGDYAEEMAKRGLDPWAEFSEEMLDYNDNDVEVNVLLWQKVRQAYLAENVLTDEQEIQRLVGFQEVWGFPFRVREAKRLTAKLRVRKAELVEKAKAEIGIWYKPAKREACLPEENGGRAWRPVTKTPPKDLNYKDPTRASFTAGAEFTPIKLMEFNPQSRPQIIDRLTTIYGWEPIEKTESGKSWKVDDTILRNLANDVPICSILADVFYVNKRLSQIATGKNAWLKMVQPDGAIHGYINPLGTVSRRASHSSPNVAQVPKVKSKKRQIGDKKISVIVRGEAGGHGYECRSLFYVPPPWRLMGSDLAGIEFRCLAELAAQYDNGRLIEVVLDGDIHTVNMEAAGLDDRDKAKTFIYAFMYGGGDAKLGSIVKPLAPEAEQRAIGAALRKTFLARMPALNMVIMDIKREAKSGFITALDGGKLYVRAQHAALNLKLQSDAALISKRWYRNYYRMMHDQGLRAGWHRDFTLTAWVHDEIQSGCRNQEIAEIAGGLAKAAARLAGQEFGYRCPVDADFKIGQTWAETH